MDLQFFETLVTHGLVPSVTIFEGTYLVDQSKQKNHNKLCLMEKSLFAELNQCICNFNATIMSPDNTAVIFYAEKCMNKILQRAEHIEDILLDKEISIENKIAWVNFLGAEFVNYGNDVCNLMDGIRNWENNGKEVKFLFKDGKSYFGDWIDEDIFITVKGQVVRF